MSELLRPISLDILLSFPLPPYPFLHKAFTLAVSHYPGGFVDRFELDFVNCDYRVQNPLVRQENTTSRSSAQSGHRIRANPQRRLPQSRYRSTTARLILLAALCSLSPRKAQRRGILAPLVPQEQQLIGRLTLSLRERRCWRLPLSSCGTGAWDDDEAQSNKRPT